MAEKTRLKRSITLPPLVFYGLGTTIGAGIFALIGEVAGRAGIMAPLSFLLATLIAAFTALSFAELASRYPLSAGEAIYVHAAFGRPDLAIAVGLAIALGGTISAAVIVNATAGHLEALFQVPRAPGTVLVAVILALVAAWGIKESVAIASLLTLIEIATLLVIIVAGGLSIEPEAALHYVLDVAPTAGHAGIVTGAFIAFYAFLGFEDMVNVAEEVEAPERTMPRGIIITLVITTLLYASLASVAVLVLSPAELGQSQAPLARIFEEATGASPTFIGVLIVLALVNGALVQIIMASRVLYGLGAQEGWLPRRLGAAMSHLSARTQTPVIVTAAIALLVTLAALALPIGTLAEATSFVLLTVFTVVNLALIRIKRRHPPAPGVWAAPLWVPWAGLSTSLAFLVAEAALRLLA
jgi:basic amino acid/polyamine antiporter, APA family